MARVLFQSIGHTDKLVGGLTCVDEMLIGKALVDEIILCSCVEKSCGFDAVEGEGVGDENVGEVGKGDFVNIPDLRWFGNVDDRSGLGWWSSCELIHGQKDSSWQTLGLGRPKRVLVLPWKV